MPNSEPPVKVLYVLGHGRSGSTVLDIVLGNHPGIESVGELTNVPTRGWARGMPCSCGEPADRCPFWSEVREEWVRRAGPGGVEDYAALQNAFEQHRRAPRLLVERTRPSGRFAEYARLNRALFRAIRAVGGREVVVDSSKNPPRAFALGAVPGIDLRPVYLVRDARGVAASRKKAFQKDERGGVLREIKPTPVWKSSARWVATNLLSEWVWRRTSRRGPRVRYEDLVTDPRTELGRIGEGVDLDLSGVADALAAGEEMRVSHVYGGNRVRMNGRVRLRADDADGWRQTLAEGEQRLAWTIAGPLLKRHGYKR